MYSAHDILRINDLEEEENQRSAISDIDGMVSRPFVFSTLLNNNIVILY